MPTGYDDGPAPLRRAGSAAGRQTASPKSWPAPSKDRKSTRLNSSHSQISYAVFCLKKNVEVHAVGLPGELLVALVDGLQHGPAGSSTVQVGRAAPLRPGPGDLCP